MNVRRSMLLELLNFFKNLFFCRYSHTFQDVHTSCDLVSKSNQKVLFVTKFKELDCDLHKRQASKA